MVDNSSAWRMSDDHKLVVPEVNGGVVEAGDLILANPNCTTMQLVMCLKPIYDKGIERGVVSIPERHGHGPSGRRPAERERAAWTRSGCIRTPSTVPAALRRLFGQRLHGRK